MNSGRSKRGSFLSRIVDSVEDRMTWSMADKAEKVLENQIQQDLGNVGGESSWLTMVIDGVKNDLNRGKSRGKGNARSAEAKARNAERKAFRTRL